MLKPLSRRTWQVIFAGPFIVCGFVTLLSSEYVGPSARDARAALVRAKWCEPDVPIIRSDGKLTIGRYECDLGERWCWAGSWDGGTFYYERPLPWCPFFGRWQVKTPWDEGGWSGPLT